MHNFDYIIGMCWDCPFIFAASLDGGIIISQSIFTCFSMRFLPIFASINAALMKMFTYVSIFTHFGLLSDFLDWIAVFFSLFQWLLIMHSKRLCHFLCYKEYKFFNTLNKLISSI